MDTTKPRLCSDEAQTQAFTDTNTAKSSHVDQASLDLPTQLRITPDLELLILLSLPFSEFFI